MSLLLRLAGKLVKAELSDPRLNQKLQAELAGDASLPGFDITSYWARWPVL
jgi:hypothetical protein